jgi:hypothetical protein
MTCRYRLVALAHPPPHIVRGGDRHAGRVGNRAERGIGPGFDLFGGAAPALRDVEGPDPSIAASAGVRLS